MNFKQLLGKYCNKWLKQTKVRLQIEDADLAPNEAVDQIRNGISVPKGKKEEGEVTEDEDKELDTFDEKALETESERNNGNETDEDMDMET
ncbi:hypothetical protein CHS0354_016869 [Potamilus streckersoni]|uniref:Uncharacterized protein n=1 Tax=Potamilus streckersoni TaxID=2493646 RepID=A0AAE0VQT1_9BIVA|nr:hypothetical protein CHS0354_016869 [Potamilus streckersoni]